MSGRLGETTSLRESLAQNLVAVNFLLLLVGLNVIGISILLIYESPLNLRPWGLFSSLPLLFHLGLGLVIFSFAISLTKIRPVSWLHYTQLVSIILILWGLPILIEKQARFVYSYTIGGWANLYHQGEGKLDPKTTTNYYNWPGVYLVAGSVLNLGVDLEILMLFTPLFFQLLLLPVLNKLFFELSNRNSLRALVSCFIFYMMNWLNQDYFSAQGLAFVLAIIGIWLLLDYPKEESFRTQRIVAIALIGIGIFLTHGLTSVFFLIAIVSQVSYTTLIPILRKFDYSRPSFLIYIFMILLGIILAAGILIAIARLWFGEILDIGISRIKYSNPLRSIEDTLELGFSEDEDRNFKSVLKIFFFILIGILALGGVFRSSASEIFSRNTSINKCFLLLAASILVFLSGLYFKEAIIRATLFSIAPLAYIIQHRWKRKLALPVVFIILFLSAQSHILLHYANEEFDYISKQQVEGVGFLYQDDYFPEGHVFVSFRSLDYFHGPQEFSRTRLSLYTLSKSYGENFAYCVLWLAAAKHLKSHDPTAYQNIMNILSERWNLIYQNGESSVYQSRF